MDESLFGLARAATRDGDHGNMIFHVRNAYDLPFENHTFDDAHCYALLTHIPDTRAAWAEVKRVLKAGGVIASREAIVASSFLQPQPPEIADAWNVFSRLVQGDGGHPYFGKELQMDLQQAGFTNTKVSASFDSFSFSADVALLHEFISDWFFHLW